MLPILLFSLFPSLLPCVNAALVRVSPAFFAVRRFAARRFRLFLMLFLAVATVAGTADAAEGMEARRIAQNASNLQKMAPVMRPKVRAVLTDLEKNGYKPIIDNAVHRTPAEQLALFKKGYSKVTYSFHNVSTNAGKADSLAADITDQRWGWTGLAPRRYWLTQTRCALSHNLYSGSFFTKTKRNTRAQATAQRLALLKAIVGRNLDYSGPIGFDPAHVEPRGLTTAQAKRGLRPYSK